MERRLTARNDVPGTIFDHEPYDVATILLVTEQDGVLNELFPDHLSYALLLLIHRLGLYRQSRKARINEPAQYLRREGSLLYTLAGERNGRYGT
jgi:hypothetical protein